jgi:hypothetical protein
VWLAVEEGADGVGGACSGRGDGGGLVEGGDFGVGIAGGEAVADELGGGNVEYPVLWNAGASVEAGFGGQVKATSGVGDFYEEEDLLRTWVPRGLGIAGFAEDDHVGLGFVGVIVLGRDIDGGLGEEAQGAEESAEPADEGGDWKVVSGGLSHFVDDLAFDQFVALREEAERLYAGTGLPRELDEARSGFAFQCEELGHAQSLRSKGVRNASG